MVSRLSVGICRELTIWFSIAALRQGGQVECVLLPIPGQAPPPTRGQDRLSVSTKSLGRMITLTLTLIVPIQTMRASVW